MNRAIDPSHSAGERGWLIFYAVAATVCRIFILGAIALLLMKKFASIGLMVVVILLVGWVLLPVLNLIRYLFTSRELQPQRFRAIFTSILVAGSLAIPLGLIHWPDRCRIEGVVEPQNYAVIHMKSTGFVRSVLDSGTRTGPRGPALIHAYSHELEAKRDQLAAEHRRLQFNQWDAQTKEAAAAQIMDEKITAVEEQIARTDQNLEDLELKAPISGVWVAPEAARLKAMRLKQGERIGIVADLDQLRIRAVASQKVASRLIAETRTSVEIKSKNIPEVILAGRIEKIIPAGQEQLPSAALGYAAGGATRIDQQDPTGRQAAAPFFEILVIPSDLPSVILRPGQTMLLRFETSPKPLILQGWRSLLQLFQRGDAI